MFTVSSLLVFFKSKTALSLIRESKKFFASEAIILSVQFDAALSVLNKELLVDKKLAIKSCDIISLIPLALELNTLNSPLTSYTLTNCA